jgi:hypothetical protein
MVGGFIGAIGCLLLAITVCFGPQANATDASTDIAAVSQVAESSPEIDALAAQVAQQITKKHLKSVAVFGATGPKTDELTQDGQELGEKFTAALTKQANGFQVVDRATLKEFAKKAGVSEAMVVSDVLAHWITRKTGVPGYVVIQIGEAAKGRVKITANLCKTSEYEGNSLSAAKTEIELSDDERRVGFHPLNSDWNRSTITIEEAKKLPPDRSPHCMTCPSPEFTDAARRDVGRNSGQSVAMYLTVFPDASIGDLAVVKRAPFGMTVTAVETVLQKWHFKPAEDGDGKPIAFRTIVEIRYQIY